MNKEKIIDLIEWIGCIIIAIVIAIIFEYYIGTTTIVKQTSMYPTLKENQRLWISRSPRTLKKTPKRGDIVTFEAPFEKFLSKEELNKNVIARYEKSKKNIIKKIKYDVLEIGKINYIKRVIGIPNDHIVIDDGKVYINDKLLDEPYLKEGVITDCGKGNCIDLIVPENTIFVLGDNRSGSTDSRCFGCIPLEKISGKVKIRIFPLKVFGKVE